MATKAAAKATSSSTTRPSNTRLRKSQTSGRKSPSTCTPKAPELAPAIVTDAPGNVFFQGDKPILQMTTAVKGLTYTLLDWHGKTLQSGDWPQDGTEPLSLPALPNGYYIVNTTNTDGKTVPSFNFTIVPHPSTRKYPHDSFFAVDSAQSWLATRGAFDCRWYDGDTYRLVSDLIAWAGFPHVRERLTWGGVNSKRDEFKYGRFMENADLLKERNILISGMFHDAPGWTDNPQGIPRDLAGVFTSCKQLAKDFGDRMGDWEFWNEQDIGFSRAPVWDYTAAMKAACLGFKAGKPDIIAAPGAACAGVFTAYHRAMYLNETYIVDARRWSDVLHLQSDNVFRSGDFALKSEFVLSFLRELLLIVCEELLRLQSVDESSGEQSTEREKQLFNQFLGMLQHEQQKRQQVSYYAEHLSITPKYLSTLCRNVSGKSPMKWITDSVMEDCYQLLRDTDITVKEISNRLGFPNSSFFGQYFREQAGMTPIEYRTKYRGNF